MKKHQHHLADAAAVGLHEARECAGAVTGVNKKTAILVPAVLGSMPFFWFCVILAIISLPAVLVTVEVGLQAAGYHVDAGLVSFFPKWLELTSVIGLVAWLAQTLIQLVALPVLQVSNNAAMAQQEHNTGIILSDGQATREHTEKILDAMDLDTQGGLKEVLDAVNRLAGP